MPTVRAGNSGDLPTLRQIQSTAVAEPWPELFDLAIAPGTVFRVAAADRPVGYAVALLADDAAYIPELAIDPAAQGKGIGSRLLESTLEDLAAEGVCRVRLTARADDDRVRSFYNSHAFAAVDRVPDHFESVDGIVYERRLEPADG